MRAARYVALRDRDTTTGMADAVAQRLRDTDPKVRLDVARELALFVAVSHSRNLLDEHGDPRRHAALHADLRDPDRLWRKVADTRVLDLDKPVAVLLIAVLHVQQPASERSGDTGDVGPAAVARYRELAPRGSYLAVSHITDEGVLAEYNQKLVRLKEMYDKKAARSSGENITRSAGCSVISS
ncbi:SAM-dependent methyltransferase [Amycolatopsis sp. CA-230715]|uniref:SAM-dependent methyltransferase n=1 Tax=Amycolatopsis sp. CA-230715 TaxID=2745196 RepID=UPI0020B2D1C0|nr:SAM-dependent methyltransferase [Amycolatopsis sp. CA-230715]